MSERDEAVALAKRVLDDVNRDPDSELSMLARQFLRAREVIEKQEQALQNVDWQGKAEHDLIQANRDAIMGIYKEALRRLKKLMVDACREIPNVSVLKQVLYIKSHVVLATRLLDAVNTFHPMHTESWCGWPEGSEA